MFRLKWPSLVRELRGLQNLELTTSLVSPFELHAEELLSLPPTLASLHLEGVWGLWDPFMDTLAAQGINSFPHLKRLVLVNNDSYIYKSDLCYHLPRGLEYLRLKYGPIKIGSSDFLPPSVTHLEMKTDSFDILEGIGFPATLTILKAYVKTQKSDWIKMLPPGLLHCHFQLEPRLQHDGSVFDWNRLPRGLLSLGLWQQSPLSALQSSSLPRGLITLNLVACQKVEDAAWALLPPTLQEIPMGMQHGFKEGKPIPASFTSLDVAMSPQSIPLLPPRITYLYLSTLQENHVHDLPRTVKRLEIGHLKPFSLRPSFYPPNLSTLYIHQVKWSKEHASSLPLNLTKLDINLQKKSEPSGDFLRNLPSCLTSLNLFFNTVSLSRVGVTLPAESSSWLPRSLTLLGVNFFRHTESGWFSFLPPQLTSLEITLSSIKGQDMLDLSRACPSLRELTLVHGHSLSSNNFLISDCLLQLPPLLESMSYSVSFDITTLDLAGELATGMKITNASLSKLPRRLKTLELNHAPAVDQQCLDFLTPSLTDLIIDWNTPLWFLNMPSRRGTNGQNTV